MSTKYILNINIIRNNGNVGLNLQCKPTSQIISDKINKSVDKLNRNFNDNWRKFLLDNPDDLHIYFVNYDYYDDRYFEYKKNIFIKKEIRKYFLEKISFELEGLLLNPDNLEFSMRLGVDVPSFFK